MEDLFTITTQEEIIEDYRIEHSRHFPAFCKKTLPYIDGRYQKSANAEFFQQNYDTGIYKLGAFQSLSTLPIPTKLIFHQPKIYITICDAGNTSFSQEQIFKEILIEKQVTVGYNSPTSFDLESTAGFNNTLVIAVDNDYIIDSRGNYLPLRPIINRLIENHIAPKSLSIYIDSAPLIEIADEIRSCIVSGTQFLNNTLNNLIHTLIEGFLILIFEKHPKAMEIYQKIEDHYKDHDKTSAKKICSDSDIGNTTLNTIYKRAFNCTAHDHANRLRMEEILHLVAQKGSTVLDAYKKVGFPNNGNSARPFYKFHGFLPSQIPDHFKKKP